MHYCEKVLVSIHIMKFFFLQKKNNLSFHVRVQNNRGITKELEIVQISEAQETPRGKCDSNKESAGGNGSPISETE